MINVDTDTMVTNLSIFTSDDIKFPLMANIKSTSKNET